MGQIDHVIWSSVMQLDYVYANAIPTKWREERDNGNPLGVPCTPEIDVPGPAGSKEQGFTSGVTIHWDPENGAYLC
jgi:hypothetical protein